MPLYGPDMKAAFQCRGSMRRSTQCEFSGPMILNHMRALASGFSVVLLAGSLMTASSMIVFLPGGTCVSRMDHLAVAACVPSQASHLCLKQREIIDHAEFAS
jgi:hypothetical protein